MSWNSNWSKPQRARPGPLGRWGPGVSRGSRCTRTWDLKKMVENHGDIGSRTWAMGCHQHISRMEDTTCENGINIVGKIGINSFMTPRISGSSRSKGGAAAGAAWVPLGPGAAGVKPQSSHKAWCCLGSGMEE